MSSSRCLSVLAHYKDCAPFLSYRLVQNKRQGTTVKQGILLWFGVDYAVPKHRWKAVAQLVKARYAGQHDLDLVAVDAQLREAAEDMVARLRAKDEE